MIRQNIVVRWRSRFYRFRHCPVGERIAGSVGCGCSYDPTREFYADYNTGVRRAFGSKRPGDRDLDISNVGSEAARAIIDGLEAESRPSVGLLYRVLHEQADLIPRIWARPSAYQHALYLKRSSARARRESQKDKDWDDLPVRVSVITRTRHFRWSRWNFLAAWEPLKKYKSAENAREFVTRLYRTFPVIGLGRTGCRPRHSGARHWGPF